jgi:hypothetical protein
MATKNDVDMSDAGTDPQDPDPNSNDLSDLLHTNHSDAFAFSESEKLALQLYHQLRELELEQSLLRAQTSGIQCVPCCEFRLLTSSQHM